MNKKKKLNLPRVPLPRQTERVVPAARGGTYNRNQSRRETRREIKEDTDKEHAAPFLIFKKLLICEYGKKTEQRKTK